MTIAVGRAASTRGWFDVLDDWLKRRALANEETGGSRTYVVCAEGRVVGYYALATGAV